MSKYHQSDRWKNIHNKYQQTEVYKIKRKITRKLYLATLKGKELYKKRRANRKRNLGFISINNWFQNSHGHHINKDVVIYIPGKLHNSIAHNHNVPKSMVEINRVAFQYLTDTIKQL